MAYVSYSPMRDLHGVRSVVSAPIVARSAFVAITAAVAILALSETIMTTAAVAPAPLAKADRIAAPSAGSMMTAGYHNDPATRTTTVERGAATPLSPNSPLAVQTN